MVFICYNFHFFNLLDLKYIIANWKLNGSKSLLNEFLNQFATYNSHNYVVLCPPHLLLSDLDSKHIDNFFMGSQNVSEYDNGAFTGEISAEMLADNKIVPFYSRSF